MSKQEFFEFQTTVDSTAVSFRNQADGSTIVTCDDGAQIIVSPDGESRLA